MIEVDMDMDADRDGIVEATIDDDWGEDIWEYGTPADGKKGAIILVNNDDDDGNHVPDSESLAMDTANDANDMSELWIHQLNLPALPQGWELVLKLDAHKDKINVHRTFPGGSVLGMSSNNSTDEYVIPESDALGSGVLVLLVEATRYPGFPDVNFDGLITLRLILRDAPGAAGASVAEDVIQVRVAPWLMPSHLDPVDTVYMTTGADSLYITRVQNGIHPGASLDDFRTRLIAALPPGTNLAPSIVTADRWPQDQFEVGYDANPAQGWKHVVLNSPRDFFTGNDPLKDYASNVLLSPEFGAYGIAPTSAWGFIGNTRESFGNLEALPPIGNWTSGHVYHGTGMTTPLQVFLDEQISQNSAPDTLLDTSWLIVGHVDEFMTIVATGPNTFRVIFANTQMGIAELETISNIGPTSPHYNLDDNQSWDSLDRTVDDLLNQNGRLQFNQNLQVILDVLRNRLVNDFGIGITDIVEVPAYFEDTGAGAVSALPDMINMLNVNGTLIVPDPMFQPFRDVFTTAVGGTISWIDCLEYHWGKGEVHCGTNVTRDPRLSIVEWWTVEPTP